MACREPEPHAREDVRRSRVRTLANFCLLKTDRNQSKLLLSAPGASLGRPDSACSLPRGGEIVQMAFRELEPHAREDVMRSRVWTPANFCLLEARRNQCKCLLSAPRASLGRPDSTCSLTRGEEIAQMGCQEPEPHAREDVMRSRVRTLANFCLLKTTRVNTNAWNMF